MQADRFTIKSQEALAAAQRLAGARAQPGGGAPSPPARAARAGRWDRGARPAARRSAIPSGCAASRTPRSTPLPTITGDSASAPALGSELIDLLQRADDEARGLGDEYVSTEHLLLALAGTPRWTWAPRATSWRRRRGGGARPAPRDRPEPRGPVPGAGALRPRPHRGGRAGQARPGDRARRRGAPRDAGALPAHQEQPRPDRRARRGQDRDRGGPRPAHRVRRRARRRCATGA